MTSSLPPRSASPRVSIVIPIFNEEPILHAAIVDLRVRRRPLDVPYEIVLAENGSRDATPEIAEELSNRYAEVRWISLPEPNYGAALRAGIESARGELVLCDEIDLCDVDFHQRATDLLDQQAADLVIGSKVTAGARDERPLVRRLATRAYNGLLAAALDFPGTDTHGLKAFRRETLLPVVRSCVVDRDVFASELVIRAHRAGLRVREIPVRVMEKRTPTINLTRRVPHVVKHLAQLTWALKK